MICDKCHAGELQPYQRRVGKAGKVVTIRGRQCSRCGFTELENDQDIWSAV